MRPAVALADFSMALLVRRSVKSPIAELSWEREPWRMTARRIAVTWIPLMAVGVLIAIIFFSDEDFIALTGMLAATLTITSVALGIFFRYGPTRRSVLAEIRQRQRVRRGELRDLAALGGADLEKRRAWYRLVRGRARRAAAARPLLALPLIAIAIAEPWKQTYDIWHPLGFACAGFFVILYGACTVLAVRGQLGDPILLVGEFEFSQHNFVQEAAKTVLVYGRTRTVTVFVRASFVLRPDGTLRTAPEDLLGRRTFGARRAVVRRLIEGEHCVLLCSGVPDVLFQAGALAATSA